VSETSWIASVPLPRSDHTIMRIKASAYDRSLNAVWDIAPLDFTTVSLYAPATVYAPDSLFSLTVQPSALYRPAPVLVDTVDVQAPNGLKRVTKGYRITWGDAPLKGKCSVRLTLGQEPPEGSALFMSSNGKSWGFLSNVRNGLEFTGDIGSSGQVAVLSDTIVPYVKPLEPRPGSSIRLRRPLLKAYIEDKGAGIGGSDSIVMTIDKITVYGEYDYEANTIAYSLHNDLQPGSHTVTVMVTDRVGNTKTSSWDFRVTK